MHNKMSRVSIYSLLFVSLILQSVFVDYIKIFGAKPDLMLLLVIFFGLFFGSSTGLETGFAAGLLKDILATDIFGMNALTLAVTGFLAGILSPKFSKESRMSQALLVFAFAIFSMLFRYALSSLLSGITYLNVSEYLFGLIIPSSFYTAAISAILFPVLMKRYHLERREEFL